jgi:hypothetical protein
MVVPRYVVLTSSFIQRITDTYLIDFGARVAAAA